MQNVTGQTKNFEITNMATKESNKNLHAIRVCATPNENNPKLCWREMKKIGLQKDTNMEKNPNTTLEHKSIVLQGNNFEWSSKELIE